MRTPGIAKWIFTRYLAPTIGFFVGSVLFHSAIVHAQTLAINELYFESNLTEGWIELKNQTPHKLRYNSVGLEINGWKTEIKNVFLEPFSYLLMPLEASAEAPFSQDPSSKIVITHTENGLKGKVHSIHPPPEGYGYARFPEESETYIFVPIENATPGQKNEYTEAWQKLVQPIPFGPRDSSPDASLLYNGKFWIFGGYQYKNGEWASSSEVWTSDNGHEWTLVLENPPFSPYSSFVTFRGYMWAIDQYAYRSKDGIIWENLGRVPLEDGGRICRLKRTLFWLKNDMIYSSNDGVSWTKISENLPFSGRTWPGFIAFQNKLWVIGGGIGYGTESPEFPNDVWVSADGVEWEQVVKNAEWSGRYWFNCVVFDGMIWILGGWNYYDANNSHAGNRNDVWYSSDGMHWTQQENSEIWPERHASFVWPTKDYLYFSSGYGGRGLETMYNDFWRMPASNAAILSLAPVHPVTHKRFSVYPNPSLGKFSIQRRRENDRIQNIKLTVTNSTGSTVREISFNSLSMPSEFTFELSPGIYLIKMCEDELCDSDKLIIHQ